MLSQRIRVFHAVANRLSYSKAAQELGISQPAVSFHIKGLEDELGVSLFERVGKQIFLTSAGRLLAEDTSRMVLLEEEVRRGRIAAHADTGSIISIRGARIRNHDTDFLAERRSEINAEDVDLG